MTKSPYMVTPPTAPSTVKNATTKGLTLPAVVFWNGAKAGACGSSITHLAWPSGEKAQSWLQSET